MGHRLRNHPRRTAELVRKGCKTLQLDVSNADRARNPSLDTNATDCAFNPSLRYCLTAYNSSEVVQPVDQPPDTLPLRSGTLTNCTDYAPVYDDVDCAFILLSYNITLDQFYSWNQEVGSDCSALWIGYNYCVALSNDDPGSEDPGSSLPTASATSAPASVSPTAFPTTAVPPGPT